MLEWLVIGGGPHGVHAAARLVGEAGVSRDSVGILDDEDVLLARWRRFTQNTGMRYLRSPAVHHLDLSSSSLQHFVKGGKGRRFARPFTRPYFRPSLDLFDRHSNGVIEKFGLEGLHSRGRASSIEISDESVRVGLAKEVVRGGASEIEARHVVLAVGAPRHPVWPRWARGVAGSENALGEAQAIRHIFDPGFNLGDETTQGGVVVVVGAGISGVQVALRCAKAGSRVILLSRHALRIHQFDSDSGWQGPKYMAGFARIQDPNERRQRIREARHRGSIPPDVHAALRCAIAEGRIEHIEQVEVESARVSGGRVSLCVDGREISADRVLLATGFSSRRPGEGWLDDAIEAHGLPCAECGYPIVDRGLRWHPRVLVTGPLAELEIGPVSRNLSGAMRAGERIAAVARSDWVF
jgi:thioredoxin reductase